MCAGIASIGRSTSTCSAANKRTEPQRARSTPESRSVAGGFADRLQDVVRLRQDRFLEVGTVRDRHVSGADTSYGRVEMLEELARHARGDFGAEAAHHLIFVRDHES